MDYSPPDSSVHGISQARILEWVAISFSRGSFLLRIEPESLVSCFGRRILYTTESPGKPILEYAAAKSLQSCPTLCDPRRQPIRLHRPWDSPGKNTGVGCHFLLQCVKVKSLSCVRLLATPWTAAYQAPPSMRFSRQKYWSGVPSPSPFLGRQINDWQNWQISFVTEFPIGVWKETLLKKRLSHFVIFAM